MQILESKLVSEIKKQYPDSMDQLLQAFSKSVYYLTYNLLSPSGTKEDIEECVADVFVDAWNKIGQYDPQKGSLRTWILMLARYKALSYKRRLGQNPVDYIEDYLFEPHDPKANLDNTEVQQLMLQAIHSFSNQDQELFVRVYFLGEPVSSLMESMELSRSAIDNRLMRCRNKIKEVLSCG